MRHARGPAPRALGPFPATLAEIAEISAARFGERIFLSRRDGRGGEPVTFRQLASDVRKLAAALISHGIGRGDRIGLISENRYQWLVADLAAATIGAVDVPRGVDTTPIELEFILGHSGCRLVFVEDDGVARELQRHLDQIPGVQMVCSLTATSEVEGVIAFDQLLRQGEQWLATNPTAVAERARRVQPGDLLTIVYTSGTTADPKGVMLTHANVLSNVRASNEVLHFHDGDRFLSVLPPWHAYERMMDYVVLSVGAEMVYTDRRRIKEDLVQFSPTVFAAVPRVWESIHDGIVHKTEKLRGLRRALMRAVLTTCRRVGADTATPIDRLTHRLLRATVLKKFARVTGGRLRIAVSGGGALPDHVDQTLLGLGIPLLNGYGLTETSPVVSVRLPERNRWGTIGPPLPHTEVQLRDDHGKPLPPTARNGVIWVRGPGVMKGYYQNQERTRQVLVDGWFDTGDLGCLDPDGQVRITGRAKDTIVLAGGENIEPERIETALKISPYIDQAVVLGQDRKSLSALLVPSETLAHEFPRDTWQIDGNQLLSPAVHQQIRKELDRLLTRDQGFRPVERIASFALLHEPLSCENGCLTPTLKVRRHIVQERYRDVIEGLFGK